MKIQFIIAIRAALALSMAASISPHDSEAQTATRNFEASIPSFSGKSLIALEVDYAPGAASPAHIPTRSRPSFMPM